MVDVHSQHIALGCASERPVDEGMTMPGNIGCEHTDLAISDLASRACILPTDPAGRLALLEKTGLIKHQDGIGIGQRLKRIIAHDVAQGLRVPASATQDRLLPLGAGIASRLRTHPSRLASFFPQQAVQKLSR